MLRNQGVHTDGEVTASKSNIIIKNKKEKTCVLIDVAIPADRNVMQKVAEKKLKSKTLCRERQRMWNAKCVIMSVIIEATGIITKGFFKKKSGSRARETFVRFTTRNSYTWNITDNTESTAV